MNKCIDSLRSANFQTTNKHDNNLRLLQKTRGTLDQNQNIANEITTQIIFANIQG